MATIHTGGTGDQPDAHDYTRPRTWPFMAAEHVTATPKREAVTQVVDEQGTISPAAWAELDAALRQPPPEREYVTFSTRQQGKSWFTHRMVQDYLKDCARRKREGQAAIAQAVHTLLTSYSPQP